MKGLLLNKLTLVWVVLCLGTLASQLLSQLQAGSIVLVIAFVKAHLVLHYFMGLNRAPLKWRAAFGSWVVIVAAGLVALHRL